MQINCKNKSFKTQKIIIILFATILSGCATSIHSFGTIDPQNKSMTLPPGAELIADIRLMLRENGWTTMVDRGPSRSEITLTEESYYDTFHTRYRMHINYRWVDICIFPPESRYNFYISIVDNILGEEVMSYGGKWSCKSAIVREIETWLQRNENQEHTE